MMPNISGEKFEASSALAVEHIAFVSLMSGRKTADGITGTFLETLNSLGLVGTLGFVVPVFSGILTAERERL